MKLIYNGRDVNRITAETINDNSARGSYFCRKLIEFEDGDRLYATEKITAGANIVFSAGDNPLVEYLFGVNCVDGKEIRCTAFVTQGTGTGDTLNGKITAADGVLKITLELQSGRTASAVKIFIYGAPVAEIFNLPATGNSSLVITIS